eukprot:TRINITY_DN126048_c0_g1_i1.p3 TRINITY_DN126048_c0_g1~~TRINITY_DN126048_c0_g1_i1.p3  ORF type:complete len:137 (+),score=40.89 TRINITY_DN126048_c0_g1_i1:78-488(+)
MAFQQASSSHLPDHILPSSSDYQEQISYGCRLVQEACTRKVTDLEKEMEGLRRESAELRRVSDGLRDRNMQLEAELTRERKKATDQMEENRGVAQQARSLRDQLSKLGRFREVLGEALNTFDDMPGHGRGGHGLHG